MTWSDEPWWQRAGCRDADPNDFARTAQRSRHDYWPEARAICGACPVREHCLDDALKHPPVYDGKVSEYDMFQGGLTPQELTTLYRRSQAAKR